MANGLDYAFAPHPRTAAIKGAGASFVCRYLSAIPANDHNGKNLLASEKEALLAEKISIVLVAEGAGSRMLAGKAAGIADASHADAVVRALGMAGMPIYFSCDFDATPAQQSAINAYLDGAASVIGRSRVGIYGGYYPVKRALDAGKAVFAWQCSSWSGGQWDSRAQLRQTRYNVTVGGVACDGDVSMAPDFGQWPRPGTAAASAGPVLSSGASGAAVSALQTRLRAWGANIAIDGVFGPITRAAVEAFQKAHHLVVDGVAGPATWAALLKSPLAPAPATFESPPEPVAPAS
jgi:hypothetical protein